MTYKYIDLRIVVFVAIVALCFSFFSQTQDHIIDLNRKIADLKTSNSHYLIDMDALKVQVSKYNHDLEINESKDKVNLLKKEVERPITTAPIKTYSQSDLTLLARLIDSEAGNQSIEGMMAVGTVVMNRVKSDEFPDTIRDVIFQKHQFSVVANGTINEKPSSESLGVAKKILEGERVLSPNVLYFYNPKISTDKWIRTRNVIKTIGDHAFAS
jgi:N-acetylmuramoyl-L-alanine amidase